MYYNLNILFKLKFQSMKQNYTLGLLKRGAVYIIGPELVREYPFSASHHPLSS